MLLSALSVTQPEQKEVPRWRLREGKIRPTSGGSAYLSQDVTLLSEVMIKQLFDFLIDCRSISQALTDLRLA
jgi:hypothetical protein